MSICTESMSFKLRTKLERTYFQSRRTLCDGVRIRLLSYNPLDGESYKKNDSSPPPLPLKRRIHLA